MTKGLTQVDTVHGVGTWVDLTTSSTYISIQVHIYNPNYPSNHGYHFKIFDLDGTTLLADRYTAQSSSRGTNYDIRFRLQRSDVSPWQPGTYYVTVDPTGEGTIEISQFTIDQTTAGFD